MSYLTAVLFHFGVPFLFSWLMAKRRYRSRADWLVMFLFVLVYIVFAFLAGRWHFFGVYWRYLLPVAFVVGCFFSLLRLGNLPWVGERGGSNWLLLLFMYLFTVLLGVMAAWAVYGGLHPAKTLAIEPPLRGKGYFIVEGGDSPLLNQYHVLALAPYKYGVDIVQLGKREQRARTFFPDSTEEFYVYGDSVYSPISGVVSTILDTLDDIPTIDTSSVRIWGNYVEITWGDTHLLLGYLQQGSISVEVGDTVRTGSFVGKVGQSGGIPEPRLHLHAYRDHPESIWGAIGLPISINGNFPVRNRFFDF